MRPALIILTSVLVGLLASVALAVAIIVVGRVSHDEARNRELVVTIQRQRVESILSSCQSQNARHEALKTYVEALLQKSPRQRGVTPAQQGRVATGFVNAIAPHQDCAAQVRQRAGTPGG